MKALTIKIAGQDDSLKDLSEGLRTPSPPNFSEGETEQMFKSKEWHNIPKCVTDMLRVLVDQTEKNRYDILFVNKKIKVQGSFIEKKCENIYFKIAFN